MTGKTESERLMHAVKVGHGHGCAIRNKVEHIMQSWELKSVAGVPPLGIFIELESTHGDDNYADDRKGRRDPVCVRTLRKHLEQGYRLSNRGLHINKQVIQESSLTGNGMLRYG